MENFVETYKSAVIQIATTHSTGTGFYLKTPNLIVTNNHVIEGNSEVMVEGVGLTRQISRVVYNDARFDLAFIEMPPHEDGLPSLALSPLALREGEIVTAVGHPYGLKYSFTQGIVSNTRRIHNNIDYIQHDAALNPGNSGGPLVNTEGAIVGVNTFIIKDGNTIGFCLPAKHLGEALDAFQLGHGEAAVRCDACLNLVFETTIEVGGYCAEGVALRIEKMLIEIGHDVRVSRRGPNSWEIRQGSARINVAYHQQSDIILCDAYLCTLPKDNIKQLYEYVLRENYRNEGITLSVRGQDIILSLLIHVQYLREDIGVKLLTNLFQKADLYDNILVEEYGAKWRTE
jgi:serine protease Do